jgi:putative membrane protein
MFICGFFVARVPDATRPEYAGVSSLFVVLFAIPSYRALWEWLGARVALTVLCALGGFAIAIETFAILTGWPYGEFSYGEKIGAKVGVVPWTVPFAWTPLVLCAVALAPRLAPLKYFVVVVAGLLVAIDLTLDPGAVHQEFWRFKNPGAYYGVPLSNYFGWLLSGAVGALIFRALIGECRRTDDVPPLGLMSSGVLILSFWTSVCTWSFLVAPAAMGWFLLAAIRYSTVWKVGNSSCISASDLPDARKGNQHPASDLPD